MTLLIIWLIFSFINVISFNYINKISKIKFENDHKKLNILFHNNEKKVDNILLFVNILYGPFSTIGNIITIFHK